MVRRLDTISIDKRRDRRRRASAAAHLGWALGVVAMGAGVIGCHRAASPPGDPMLEAIRAEEREAGFTYAEGQGRQLFRQYCATCHGDEGKGDGQNASNLNPSPPDFTASTRLLNLDYVRRVIAQGSAAVGRSPLSPPWGRNLRSQDIEYLTAYCHALAPKK